MHPLNSFVSEFRVHSSDSVLALWEVISRIDWPVVQADFIVKMGRRASTRRSHITNDVAFGDVLSGMDLIAGQVSETGCDPVAMVEHDQVPVIGLSGGINHNSGCRGTNCASVEA
jgi:hypothetical protein